jgi:glycosyltransferase involved in cell wall biosynthesis
MMPTLHSSTNKKLFIVVNVDWFFLSHRLPIALAAKQSGFDVTIVSFDTGRAAEIESHGLKFLNAPFSRSGTNISEELSLVIFLKKLYKKHRPDIVHHVTLKPAIYGSLAARKVGIPIIINAISGLGYNFTDGRKGVKQLILGVLLKRAFGGSKLQFIFQNMDDVEVFKNMGMVGDDQQIHLIKGSGVDLNDFKFVPEPETEKLTILLPARMLYDKGVAEFVRAAQSLKSKYADKVCFNLAGDIDPSNPAAITEAELQAMLDAPYINWIGYQISMARVLSDHHIIVLPSYREGLPKSLIEACAIGRPIITTDAPGCKECVTNGYNGFLVPVKDHVLIAEHLETLINDKALRFTMGKNSRTTAEEMFSIENVINRTLEIYNRTNQ